MSYKSHKKSPCRAFDHLYDPVHVSTVEGMRKMNVKALKKTAPFHIIPCYSSMFSDLITKRRNFYFQQRNALPSKPCQPPIFVCNRAINTNIFVINPVEVERNLPKEVVREKPQETRSVLCQTKFRESSAQTDPWLPDAKLREGEKCFPEILTVDCCLQPGVAEVEAIERSRLRKHWENLLPDVTKEELPLRLAQLEAFEWENFVEREREMNEAQSDRMEQVIEMIDQRRMDANIFNDAILENVYERSKAELEKKRSKLYISHQRKLRKLSKLSLLPDDVDNFKRMKSKPSQFLSSSKEIFKSEIFCTSSINVSKRLNSRKKLYEPKESTKEIAHGMRSEINLRSLCDSLKRTNKHEKLQCRSRRSISSEVVQGFDDQQEIFIDMKDAVRKTLKAFATQINMLNGLKSSLTQIEDCQRAFPVCSCDSPAAPTKREISVDKNLIAESLVAMVVDYAFERNSSEVVNPVIDDMLATTNELITRKIHHELLLQAEKNRSQRKKEKIREEELRLLRKEIKRQIDAVQTSCTEDILKKVLPSVIEIIAATEAQKFVVEAAMSIDQKAWNSSTSNKEIVDEVLKEILVPEIVKRVEHQSQFDATLNSFLASHDALEIYLDKFPINLGEFICKNLVEDILSKLEI